MGAGDKRTLSVTQLNMYVKSLLESSSYLSDIELVGEISNFTNHYKSGHFYLSLKDDGAVIKAVMFRQYAQKLDFVPDNGMKVVCEGRVSLYERDGAYQFYITSMKPEGAGDLAAQFEALKNKLAAEGLFDSDRKRPIPKMPRQIAVITSPTGAAVQDIMNILRRRYPVVRVILCPVQVQGDSAAPSMVAALERVNELHCADTIIIGRGGGSIEDLWAFNDETLARTVAASKIPVISGVGHETDFTICDFAADLRAPTPSGAAELAVPEKGEILEMIKSRKSYLKTALGAGIESKRMHYELISRSPALTDPMNMVETRSMMLDKIISALYVNYSALIAQKRRQFLEHGAKIEALSPMNVLMRGYSVVMKDGAAVSGAATLDVGDKIKMKFSDGDVNAVVTEKDGI